MNHEKLIFRSEYFRHNKISLTLSRVFGDLPEEIDFVTPKMVGLAK